MKIDIDSAPKFEIVPGSGTEIDPHEGNQRFSNDKLRRQPDAQWC